VSIFWSTNAVFICRAIDESPPEEMGSDHFRSTSLGRFYTMFLGGARRYEGSQRRGASSHRVGPRVLSPSPSVRLCGGQKHGMVRPDQTSRVEVAETASPCNAILSGFVQDTAVDGPDCDQGQGPWHVA